MYVSIFGHDHHEECEITVSESIDDIHVNTTRTPSLQSVPGP